MIAAILLIAAGAYLLVMARTWIILKQRTHQRRLDDRLARGKDVYFDELRALQTYTPDGKVRLIRFLGAAMLITGSALLILTKYS